MSTLIVENKIKGLINNKPLIVIIDEVNVENVKSNSKKILQLTEGNHTIMFKFDWAISQKYEVELSNYKNVRFTIKPLNINKFFVLFGIVPFILAILLRIFTNINLVIFSFFPFFIVLLYHSTIGSRKYLDISME